MDVVDTTTMPEPEVARLDRGALHDTVAAVADRNAAQRQSSLFPSYPDRRRLIDPGVALSRLGMAALATEALLVTHRTRRSSRDRRTS